MIDPLALGQRIRQAREQAGLSQTQVANTLNLDQSSISELERGRRRLFVSELLELARLFDRPVLYFLNSETEQSDRDLQLLQYFHRLPSSKAQQIAIDIIRLLAQITP